ncbi:nuclear transport factor 2 family protein [Paremcibacter congregatus]|uniref:nuclear transport factor 2 family protein n=1 Tax=Paremcibacter congregatus TaxID=2043170 RepID=UPI0030EC0D75|tara:strand:- start:2241 stop:2741 length:501 start_codon:yes stop_codon:yes gene_type:complete
MKKISLLVAFLLTFLTVPAIAADDKAAINALVDGFHAAAAAADKEAYLGHMTADGVFMGTDDWERWAMQPDFQNYVAERFKGGTGWTYKSVERHIAFDPTGKVAWFDEITKSEKWGLFRGTGVVLKAADGWKIAHYSMSVLVPNEAWVPISDLAKAAVKRRDADKK